MSQNQNTIKLNHMEKMLLIMKYSEQIQSIVDHKDDMDNGDYQGAIEAQLSMLINELVNYK